jgi:DivIVA domain-containing protein
MGMIRTAAHSWRPEEVRRRNFTVRFRGLDRHEVQGFLKLLADDLTRLHEHIALLTQENARLQERSQELQEQLRQARVDPQEQVTDQAVLLLNQAQQLADALIDEGMQSARDMLLAARSQQRDIILPGGEGTATVAQIMAPVENIGEDQYRSSEVEDVRMFAKVAQLQFRAVLDALDEQVNRLGQYSDTPTVSTIAPRDRR